MSKLFRKSVAFNFLGVKVNKMSQVSATINKDRKTREEGESG